jgi:septum formation protein
MPTPPARVLLASASPRRRRLLTLLGIDFEATSVDVDETIPDPLPAGAASFAGELAARKAAAALSSEDTRLVLAFDTLVLHEGRVLGKPRDESDAVAMLRSLSGREHAVVTGVAVSAAAWDGPLTQSVVTAVEMRELSERDIDRWVEQGECMGCAGAYNIERHLATVSLDECFQNVAGLPLCHLYATLNSLDGSTTPPGLVSPVAPCDAARGVACRLGPTVTGRG